MNKLHLDMRIATRSKRIYKVDKQSIQSVPDVDCFIEPEINKAITQGCKEVLMASYNSKLFQHGECALLMSTLKVDAYGNKMENIHMILQGNHRSVEFNNEASNIVRNRETKDLIVIHNHPSNGTFSYGDLRALSKDKSILSVVVIGNTRNLYVAIDDYIGDKITSYVERRCKDYLARNKITNLSENRIKAIKDTIVANEVLTNPNKFRIVYIKYNRRSV